MLAHSTRLRHRLAALIGVCSGLTALLCMATIFATSLWVVERRSRDITDGMARMVAIALQPALARQDKQAVADTLAMLRARPQITGTWVYLPSGALIGRRGQGEPPAMQPSGGIRRGYTVVVQPVAAPGAPLGQPLGQVVMQADLAEGWYFIAVAMAAIATGSLLALLLSALLALRMARRIAQPIAQLAATADAITKSQDYSQRLPAGGSDEIGTATNAFNNMLAELQQRGDALLELRVADRTHELRAEKERAEAASLAKTSFLSHMSHELRTPLNAVIGAAQLLDNQGMADERQAELVLAIRDSGIRLLGLIENILDLSRIESGALDLLHEDFNLIDCVEAAVATAAVPARLKGLNMACIVAPDLAEWRHGDALRLRQVLLNVLGNAIKFTAAGEVVISVQAGAQADAVLISVRDSGIGISAQAAAQIFEPFRQADSSTTRRYGGSGLGLSISRRLAHAMGGHLTLCAAPSAGSQFDLELPLPPAARCGAGAPALNHAVVYFEPHEPSAQALGALLRRLGCQATRCTTSAALQAWMSGQASARDKPWLLVAVDEPQTWPLLEASLGFIDAERVIGMSHLTSHTVERARELFRVPRNVVKPVLRTVLVSRVGAVARSAVPVPPQGALAASPTTQPRVLVVEDDPLNQMIVCTMLANAGCQAFTANNGNEALHRVGTEAFDLVLMDWQMPDIDGLEVTRRLRAGAAGARGKSVPIVALTANAFTEDRAACLAAGMNDFLSKPVLAANLQAAVRRWVGADDARPGSESAPRPVASRQAPRGAYALT